MEVTFAIDLLYSFDGKKLKKISGEIIWEVSDGSIKDFYGRILYRIDGYLSERALKALILLLIEGKL